ncbi:MAG: transglycosylase SLT domain-containing protein [Bacteroidota bacterium]
MCRYFIRFSITLLVVSGMSIMAIAGCKEPAPSTGNPMSRNIDSTKPFLERTVIGYETKTQGKFINNDAIFKEGWDTLSHVRFWQEIMAMPHDSLLLNVAHLRKPLFSLHVADWSCQTVDEKDEYKRLVCVSNDLSSATSINVTSGKEHFFEFRKVLPMIPTAIEIFEQEGTDPWYAQTILLIESPGKTHGTSYAGARGAFQLMPSVARSQGLVVTNSRDDRTDLRLSAAAAARFIRKVCVAEGRRLLNRHSVPFNESDLWFRLFVMHIYHSGAGNLSAALNSLQPTEGGMDFIRKLWRTEAAGFKNESQNYSQVALAAMVNFDRLLNSETDLSTVYLVHGDKRMDELNDGSIVCVDTVAYLAECLEAYGTDLVEGVIPVSYFLESELRLVNQLNRICENTPDCAVSTPTIRSERIVAVASKLITKRKLSEAISILEKSLEINPLSFSSYNLIISAYKKSQNTEMVVKYTRARDEMVENPSRFLR